MVKARDEIEKQCSEFSSTHLLIDQPSQNDSKAPCSLGVFSPIALAEDRHALQQEINECESLGETRDDKKILLFRYRADSVLMNEIGRLREESFRLIGEGTGQSRDIDKFDQTYLHIVLWDEQDLEVVGAYRLCSALTQGSDYAFYTASLFKFKSSSESFLSSGLELGRSFVQEKYWGSRSLEYLWYGISAFLRKNPQYRYLFGAVSISNTLSVPAKDLLVRYYQTYHGTDEAYVTCSRPFQIESESKFRIDELFDGQTAKQAFVTLKKQLRYLGFAVPVLYKQYAELTKPGGTRFLGFSIDPDFNDCIDGLVVVDIDEMSEKKRKRYGLIDHRMSKR